VFVLLLDGILAGCSFNFFKNNIRTWRISIMKMKKKEVVLALLAMFGLAAESSASAGLGASTGLGVSTGSGAYIGSDASTNLGASTNLSTSTNLGTSTDLGASTNTGTSQDVGTSTNLGVDLGVSPGLGISTGTGVLTSTSGLTALDAAADIAATVPVPGTAKATVDSPALGVTSDVTAPKLSLTADADTSTSNEINALVASAAATTNTGISAAVGTDIANAGVDIAGQSTNTFDLSAAVGVENALPLQLPVVAGTPVSTVPEADAYAMLLAGLGLMGFMVNRRKEKLK